MKLEMSKFYPKTNQIMLTTEVDDSYYTLIDDSINTNNGFNTDYENNFKNSLFNKTAKIVLANENDELSGPITLLDYYKPNFKKFLDGIFNNEDNMSIRYLYLEKKKFETVHNHKIEILQKYYDVFNQSFATKNTRLKANKEIIISYDNEGNKILKKAYPFILAEGQDFNGIDLYMVARCFYIPMEKNILNDRMAVYKYPEWFMNRKDLIDAVEDTIYIDGEIDSGAEFYGTEEKSSSLFGNDPRDYENTLGNINILNFYKRHGEYYPLSQEQTQQTT